MGWKLKPPPRLGGERETKSDTKTKEIGGSRQHGQGPHGSPSLERLVLTVKRTFWQRGKELTVTSA